MYLKLHILFTRYFKILALGTIAYESKEAVAVALKNIFSENRETAHTNMHLKRLLGIVR